MEATGTDDNIDNNGEKWTEMDELDAADGEEACDKDGLDGEKSQLPDDLASCFKCDNTNDALWSYYSNTVEI